MRVGHGLPLEDESRSMEIHLAFDVLAWATASLVFAVQGRLIRTELPVAAARRTDYLIWLLLGAAAGAYGLGTLNLWLSGLVGIARSIEGALAGGILAVELFKLRYGIVSRTGARLALPFTAGIVVGRIGCYLAGLDDFTYGIPTDTSWGHDYGDGILRHPVQLYESAAMLAWGIVLAALMRLKPAWVMRNGFYATVAIYAGQRFVWEFLKPYASLIGPFTVFHIVAAALVVYALYGLSSRPSEDRP